MADHWSILRYNFLSVIIIVGLVWDLQDINTLEYRVSD